MKTFIILFLALFFVAGFAMLNEKTFKQEEFNYLLKEQYPHLSEDDALLFSKGLEKHSEWYRSQNFSSEPGLIVPFNCQPFGRSEVAAPTSVHDVKPPYIDVIGAIGDSITAGFGAKAKWIWEILTEYRGVSWSVGGDANITTVLTLANLLEAYNPNIVGFSTGTGKADKANAHFNQAVSGGVAPDLLGQAKKLKERMLGQLNETFFEESYKMITVFIGGNDLCAACDEREKYSTANYITNVEAALTYMRDNFPNTIVNLVPAIDVTELSQLHAGLCDLLHVFECSCVNSQSALAFTSALQDEYVQAAFDITNKTDEFTTDTFTVIMQPFMSVTHVPMVNGKPDMSFFAMDCFHLSQKGHQAAAVPLWNNIFEKVNHKDTNWDGPGEAINCPTKDDYIWTTRNSN